MSVSDTDTKRVLPAEARKAIAEGRIPVPESPRKPYVGKHFRIEDQETRKISPEKRAALRAPSASKPAPVPDSRPSDQSMRKLARLLGNLRKPRWLP